MSAMHGFALGFSSAVALLYFVAQVVALVRDAEAGK